MRIDTSAETRHHPDRWTPTTSSPLSKTCRPQAGDLLGWRYAAWRVRETRVRDGVDLSDEDQQRLQRVGPVYQPHDLPYTLVLAHERGPVLLAPDVLKVLHDGAITTHIGVPAASRHRWSLLDDRYAVCSCHAYPYPCQALTREWITAEAAQRMEKLLATTTPNICAGCRAPISAKQKRLTFPDPSLIVPGAPGPSFHAARRICWEMAVHYELELRLDAYPDAARVASCPGALFRHAGDGRQECTAENACTGHHGPAGPGGRFRLTCSHRVYVGSRRGCYPRPPGVCGEERCLGRSLELGAPDPTAVGDMLAGRGGRQFWI